MTAIEEDRRSIERQLEEFCLTYPRYAGLYQSASFLAGKRMGQIRALAGLARREVAARLAGRPGSPRHGVRDVLVDAALDGIHARLWVPIAADLARHGRGVSLLHRDSGFPRGLLCEAPELRDTSWYEFVRVREGGWSGAFREKGRTTDSPTGRPGRGVLGAMIQMQIRHSDRLVSAFGETIRARRARAIVTTSPFGDWSHPLIVAARAEGATSFYVQQGFPAAGVWCHQFCDLGIVWTSVGKEILRRNGWSKESIVIARNPSIPGADWLKEARVLRRAALGLRAGDICVLYLGQKMFDWAFEVKGYPETVRIVGEGLRRACERRPQLAPVLRRHPREATGATEAILSSCGVRGLVVASDAPLMHDVAAADLVVSMHSAALEEAYLAGRPIAQVVAQGLSLGVDFGTLGAPVIESAEELTSMLTGGDAIGRDPKPGGAPSVVSVIEGRLGDGAQTAKKGLR